MDVDHRWWDRIRLRDSFDLLNISSIAISFAIYLLNEHLLKQVTSNPFIGGHLNDFLAIWIFIPYCNVLLSFHPYKKIRIATLPACVMVSVIAGLGWECLTPLYLENSVSDPVDFLMYLLAGVLYAVLIKRKHSRSTRIK